MQDTENKRWITWKGRRFLVKDNGKILETQDYSLQKPTKQFKLSSENIDLLIKDSINEFEENYARDYITRMSPSDYLKLTASDNTMKRLEEEKFDLDLDILNKKGSWIYLDIDLQTGEVLGHEGRHRMLALKNANYDDVDVVIFPRNYDKYNAQEYNYRKLIGQGEDLKNNSVVVKKLIPVSKKNIERIKKRDY